MNNGNQNEYFQTKDQYLATLLFCLDIPLEKTEQKNGVVFFVFKNKEKSEQIIKEYYQNKLQVNPKKFVDSFGTIKHFIFN